MPMSRHPVDAHPVDADRSRPAIATAHSAALRSAVIVELVASVFFSR
jgi:hypothetical protein